MRVGVVVVIAARAAVDLRGILRRHQVVGHGDGRQQDEDHDRESDHLDAAIGSLARRRAYPCAQHPYGHQRPTEIESQLHSQSQFYIRNDGQKIAPNAKR